MNASDFNTNMSHGYYNGWSVEDAVKNDALSEEKISGTALEFIEVKFPDGRTLLCINTGVSVGNGPGKKYTATEAE